MLVWQQANDPLTFSTLVRSSKPLNYTRTLMALSEGRDMALSTCDRRTAKTARLDMSYMCLYIVYKITLENARRHASLPPNKPSCTLDTFSNNFTAYWDREPTLVTRVSSYRKSCRLKVITRYKFVNKWLQLLALSALAREDPKQLFCSQNLSQVPLCRERIS